MAATSTEILSRPLTLPCGLVLPNRLVKCPMQETLAVAPLYDPPVAKFEKLYGIWSGREQQVPMFGLIITGQVQVDIRYLSVRGDVCMRPESLEGPTLELWKQWANIAQSQGSPCLVQIAHPGRMSPRGAGNRPIGAQSISASDIKVKLGETWLDKKTIDTLLGTPRPATHEEIDEVVGLFVHAARVAQKAGFAGCQLHCAHGFLLSQFLSPHTNRRTDAYGGSPAGRMLLMQRIVKAVREACPPPYCLSVKLNSGDYMAAGGLTTEEALEQVRWLVECAMVDLVEISGGNAEGASAGRSPLHRSFGTKTLETAPVRSSTRIRESYFADFSEQVFQLKSKVPIQLSGGFRSRTGMADAIDSGFTDLIGLGRSIILDPRLPSVLLDPNVPDELAFAASHQVQGLKFASYFPRALGLPIMFFYHNMKRHGQGLEADKDVSIPMILLERTFGVSFAVLLSRLFSPISYMLRLK